MGKSEGSQRGPDESVSRERIADAIRGSDKHAVTAPDIAEAAGLTNKTVYKHLEIVEAENGDIQSEEIGGSTAYWARRNTPTTGGVLSHEPQLSEPDPQTDGGLGRFEATLLWVGTFGLVAGLVAVVALAGLGLESFGLWPKAAGDIHLTAYALEGSLLVFSASIVAILIVVFREYLSELHRKISTEWLLLKDRVCPHKRRVERWVADNRPGIRE